MTIRRTSNQPMRYLIRVKGCFDEAWLAYWFEGFVLTQQSDEQTTLTGTVKDESAFHGLLARIRDLGLELLLLERIENQQTDGN